MRKTYLHFEIVPVEVAEKILEQESSPAKRNGKCKLAVKKPGKARSGPRAQPRKVEVLVP